MKGDAEMADGKTPNPPVPSRPRPSQPGKVIERSVVHNPNRIPPPPKKK